MHIDFNHALELALGKIDSWVEALGSMIPNFVVAVLVLIFFFLFAKIARRISSKLLNRFSSRKAINGLFTTLIYILIIGVGLVIALNVLKLERTVTSILAGAGIIGLALGFAFQDIAANFMSGILMAIRQPIKVGDIIKTQDYMGTVELIDLRVTVLRTFQGLHVLIPNKEIFQNPITNYTKTNDVRIDLEVGVSYADDLEKVKKVVLDTVKNFPFLIKDKEFNMYYHSFGDSSINFTLVFWIDYKSNASYMSAQSDAIIAIKKAFDANDITIPFPIRTLDFGIKGGEKLSEMSLKKDL